jgi:hypothetical protein
LAVAQRLGRYEIVKPAAPIIASHRRMLDRISTAVHWATFAFDGRPSKVEG